MIKVLKKLNICVLKAITNVFNFAIISTNIDFFCKIRKFSLHILNNH